MRELNFKVGWIIPNKIAALTHYHSEITPNDIYGVMQASQNLLQDVKVNFHMIIDNRVAPLSRIYSLIELQKLSPILRHQYLKYLIVIKPLHLALPQKQEESLNGITLKNVSSTREALEFLAKEASITMDNMNKEFFPILS